MEYEYCKEKIDIGHSWELIRIGRIRSLSFGRIHTALRIKLSHQGRNNTRLIQEVS